MNKLWYKKRSSLHGSGLFADTNIKNKEQVIQYIGDKVTKKEGDKRADIQLQKAEKNKKTGMVYVFELNKKYDIDGGVLRNHARFINHSCDPNCEVEITNNEIWISAIKNIKEDTELTYNYGYPFDSDFEEHICKCGTKKCVGYILSDDDWPKLKKELKKKKKTLKKHLVSIHSVLTIQYQQKQLIQISFLKNLFLLMEIHTGVYNLYS